MTMFSSTFPQRLSKIDDLTRPDHSYLTPEDDCYFLGEYTARAGYSFSATNDLISNFKKSVDRRDLPEYRYKGQSIAIAAQAFRKALQDPDIDFLTFVPVPPSKSKSDPLYDDRITLMLNQIRPDPPMDVRELVIQTQSTPAAHLNGIRPSPQDLERLYIVDESILIPPICHIAIVDDVLTTGAHFRAVKSILANRLPESKIIGLFIARTAIDTDDIDDF
jgi:hypothetical protein